MALYSLGRTSEAGDLLTEAAADPEVSSTRMAEAYAFMGEPDKAFEWLEQGFEARHSQIGTIKGDPFLVSLHGDPRWTALLRKIGLAG